jgi:glutamyl-tRNA(Gln) amidotransferase subunit E
MNRNYKALGLRIGLEIHQQLDSGHKLFCGCPIMKSDDFPISVTRRLRPAAGELDVVDPAAIYEFLRKKKFVYKLNPGSSCLVELDEKPPDPVNSKALEVALKMAKMLDAFVVDEVHVMRKTVIDGSSVSGFQRTALVSIGGSLETSFGKVGITTMSLEEDSATALQKGPDFVEYRLDRLGIPLIEIGTAADMHSPEEAKETAEKLGTLLRSFPVVRGIGSIRQDVNVSIESGARIEIKGFQELEKIPVLIENEVERQISLLEIRDELTKRGFRERIDRQTPPTDVTTVFANAKGFVGSVVKAGGKVFAARLPLFSGLLKKQCGDRTFGKELAGYAEAFGFGGIIHSDENPEKYNFVNEFAKLKAMLSADERDAVILVAGEDEKNIVKAMNFLVARAFDCLSGVPEETRVANGIGSKYTRPLPGSGRLYPESDIPPIKIDRNYLVKLELPKTIFEIQDELEKILPKEMAGQIVRSRYYPLFDEFRNFGPGLVASVFLSVFTDLRRRGFDIDRITKDHLFKIFSLVKKGEISKDALTDIFELLSAGVEVDEVIAEFSSLSEDEIRAAVSEAISKNPRKNESAIIGIVMQQLRGRADGKLVAKIVREALGR